MPRTSIAPPRELLRTGQASFEIQPRVFDERFPHTVLYVRDVSAAATRWSGIFLVGTQTRIIAMYRD